MGCICSIRNSTFQAHSEGYNINYGQCMVGMGQIIPLKGILIICLYDCLATWNSSVFPFPLYLKLKSPPSLAWVGIHSILRQGFTSDCPETHKPHPSAW